MTTLKDKIKEIFSNMKSESENASPAGSFDGDKYLAEEMGKLLADWCSKGTVTVTYAPGQITTLGTLVSCIPSSTVFQFTPSLFSGKLYPALQKMKHDAEEQGASWNYLQGQSDFLDAFVQACDLMITQSSIFNHTISGSCQAGQAQVPFSAIPSVGQLTGTFSAIKAPLTLLFANMKLNPETYNDDSFASELANQFLLAESTLILKMTSTILAQGTGTLTVQSSY